MDYDERIETFEEVLNLLRDMKVEITLREAGFKPTVYKPEYLEKLFQDVGYLLIHTELDKEELEDENDT